MASTVYFPMIHPKDFEAFKVILDRDLPDTYEGWQEFISNRIRHIDANAEIPHGIEVDPHEFSNWLPTRWDKRTISGLFEFAAFKAASSDTK